MNLFDRLKENPYFLSDSDIDWVKSTLQGMTVEEKVGQLFCLILREGTEEEVERIKKVLSPCGVMYRTLSVENAVSSTELLAKSFKIPMLIAANLEKGGNGIVSEGTLLGSPMQVGATDDPEMAEKLGIVCGREGAAVGANWAFAPIIDIDYNFRNPITNTRTFGSDPDRVRKMGAEYVKAVQKHGVAASIKHFPGDGRDERDQHLVTTINDFSTAEWDSTYGRAYKESIDAGALTVMIGHIMLPEYSRKLVPGIKDNEIMPATLAPEIMNVLLREHLGFNGTIVTDATTMAGYNIAMPRSKAVPFSIAAGADVFLFAKNMEEDYGFMLKGVEDGTIPAERLDEAVTRILALKAALKLHEERVLPTVESARDVLGCEEHLSWAAECADKAVTLVKEEAGVLPITPEKFKRILFYPIESEAGDAYSVKAGVCAQFKQMLSNEGFEVTEFTPQKLMEGRTLPVRDFTDNYDLIIYLANMSTKSNQTTVRIEWSQPMGSNCPTYIEEIPTVFISVENPYHLLDVPRVKTFINAYNSNEYVLEAIINKLMGQSEFKGVNPVDPFCGMWDTRL